MTACRSGWRRLPRARPGAAAAAVPLEALAARIAAVWARCGGEGDAGVAARSSPLALLAGLEVLVLRCGGHVALGCVVSRVNRLFPSSPLMLWPAWKCHRRDRAYAVGVHATSAG